MAMTSKGPTFTAKGIRWAVHMPGHSNATPLVVGDRVFTTSDPNDLVCLDKNTGKVLWVRSTLATMRRWRTSSTGINLDEKKADVASWKPSTRRSPRAGSTIRKLRDGDRVKLAASIQDWVGKTKEYSYHCPGWGGGNSAPSPCTDGKFVYVWHGEAGLLGCYGLDGTRVWTRYIHPLDPARARTTASTAHR